MHLILISEAMFHFSRDCKNSFITIRYLFCLTELATCFLPELSQHFSPTCYALSHFTPIYFHILHKCYLYHLGRSPWRVLNWLVTHPILEASDDWSTQIMFLATCQTVLASLYLIMMPPAPSILPHASIHIQFRIYSPYDQLSLPLELLILKGIQKSIKYDISRICIAGSITKSRMRLLCGYVGCHRLTQVKTQFWWQWRQFDFPVMLV